MPTEATAKKASGLNEPPATERNFVLADGYRTADGELHKEGRLRAATVRDELRVLADFRVYLHPPAFIHLLLARTIRCLGTIEAIDVGVVENLSGRDRARLESLCVELNDYPRKEPRA